MKNFIGTAALVAVLITPAIGAAPQVQSEPRDVAPVQTALQDLNEKTDVHVAAIAETDQALAELEAAQQNYDEKKAAEATARVDVEQAQQVYADAYDALPKEDSLP